MLHPAGQGKGYAQEAVAALRTLAFDEGVKARDQDLLGMVAHRRHGRAPCLSPAECDVSSIRPRCPKHGIDHRRLPAVPGRTPRRAHLPR
jgi:hypothetical protein